MSMIPPREQLRTFPPAGLARTELVSPRTIDEACALLAQAKVAAKRAVLLAGGTDWLVGRHLAPIEKAAAVDLVIDVTSIAELAQIEAHERGGERRLTLGGGVTYWTIRQDARIAGTIPMLARMARDVGAVQTQTRGTLAGNIASASPTADGVAAMMALDAVVVLRAATGERRVPLEAFFTGDGMTVLQEGELIAAIELRVPREGARATWRKVGARLAQAISKVALAAVIEADADGVIAHARFGMAAVAPVIVPLARVRALVEGKRAQGVDGDALAAAVARDVSPIDDVRSTGDYRSYVARALVERALLGEA